ncbi:uncharacterized protein A1O9_01929 [Exophiala aquamarina CBS 119918]|uniref:DUF7820 domain-containing protein n=1 Tax=Exophiala aquamarina CBS 119918 TaxID=1182545 RepID=A0A072PJU9_9EURO|nr:uncharacterized protein A1O9_01929 [Exophiala aquamarina CBS 119918]KEF60369.1 hypothetical protein A1O9_01929 [Exophiala aquamarina CBS 119918]
MARRPPSTSSLSAEPRPSYRRTSSNSSNPNVFSDDYAADNPNPFASATSSPIDSIDSRSDRLSLNHHVDPESDPREYTPAGLPGNLVGMGQISAMSGTSGTNFSTTPQRTVSTSSHSIADTHRTLSTSSRFSLPRAPSPYNGPTAPSQPYGLYPQATRASSIASEATIRPIDRPFVPQGGPEHPYGMYQQNTVPEEGDDSQLHIPLGFPGLGQSSQSSSHSSGDEVGDIVGSDGHVEQLPPYSRYADNVIAKGDMARIEPPTVAIDDPSPSPTTQPVPASSSNIELTNVGDSSSSDEVARKEGLAEQKRNKRMCFGIPFWTFVIIVAVVIIAALLGGVIGGVVGTKKGTDRANGSATTTIWLDADPAQTDGSTGPCPTGHYTLALNQTEEVDTCVVDPALKNAWGCMDFAKLGINIFEIPNGGSLQVVFDDYSIRPQQFKYGPQPPDFNGTAFTMEPYMDREDDDLGVALFFSVLFDKLSILPAEALSPPSERKRSIPASHLTQRTDWEDPNWLSIGDQPWYCYWNSTVSEFWIFLDQDMNLWDSWAATSTITSGYPTSTGQTSSIYPTNAPGAPTTNIESKGSPPQSSPTPYNDPYWNGAKNKRQTTQIGAPGIFPKLVKMVEKRKPHSNIQPYCQQMQVLNNWQIMPIPTVPTICVTEDEYSPPAATDAGNKHMSRRKRSPDTVSQLASNCICEWFSDY